MDLYAVLSRLLGNLTSNLSYLKQDYLGFSINYGYISYFAYSLLLALFTTFIVLLMGNKLRKVLSDKNSPYNFFIDLGLGYIFIGTGIALLGFLSILNSISLTLYLITVFILSIFPLKNTSLYFKSFINTIKSFIKTDVLLSIFVGLFVFLAFINLFNPEIREDQYHVDFAKMYLSKETIMIPPKEQIGVSGGTMLGEMHYIIGLYFGSQEIARTYHFLFYLSILLLLLSFSKQENGRFAAYALLIFAASPVVIKETSSAYVDFQWMFCQLLSVLLITGLKKANLKSFAIPALLTGGMLATKLWTIAFLPVSLIYLGFILRQNKQKVLKNILFFFLISLTVPLIWYLRSYILTGTPFYPAFATKGIIANSFWNEILRLTGINLDLFNIKVYLAVFSPLFFTGIILILLNLKKSIKILKSNTLFLYLLFMFLLLLIIKYYLGRYLLGFYVFLSILASVGFSGFSKKTFSRFIAFSFAAIIFIYYFANSLLVVPYTLGVADKNSYLTRILSTDVSSYYDFGRAFEKYISKNDCVATYRFYGFYYANFCHMDVNFVFGNSTVNSIDALKNNGYTKLLTLNRNADEFCKEKEIVDCDKKKFKLLSNFNGIYNYYLYKIK